MILDHDTPRSSINPHINTELKTDKYSIPTLKEIIFKLKGKK